MKGVPLRVEIGPKDMEKDQLRPVRRDNGEKVFVALDELETRVPELLDAVHDGLYQRAKKNLEDHTYAVPLPWRRSRRSMEPEGGFIKTMWCGDAGLRAQDEGGGRHDLPLRPLRPGAPGGHLPHLRPAGPPKKWYFLLGAWPTNPAPPDQHREKKEGRREGSRGGFRVFYAKRDRPLF